MSTAVDSGCALRDVGDGFYDCACGGSVMARHPQNLLQCGEPPQPSVEYICCASKAVLWTVELS